MANTVFWICRLLIYYLFSFLHIWMCNFNSAVSLGVEPDKPLTGYEILLLFSGVILSIRSFFTISYFIRYEDHIHK